jgi:RNA polymerase sigma factor (sigma-70 family)
VRADAGPERLPPFQTFVDEHRSVVYRFLVSAAGPIEADDCFQETFLSAMRAYPNLRDASNLRGWILTIATRKAIDAGRGRSRRPVPHERAVEIADAAASSADPISDPDDPLWDAVRTLPPRQRAAVVHRHVLDRSYGDIAEAMGCSEQTARSHVAHGMRTLRARLGER